MNTEQVKAKYEAAMAAEVKQQGTIERHKGQLAKKVAKFEKDYNVSLEGQDLTALDALKWPGGQTCTVEGQYWDACAIEHKMDDIKSATKKLAERERITAEAFDKLDAREKQDGVFNDLPPIILEFAARYKVRTIGWLIEGAEKYRAKMKEIDEDGGLDRKGRNAAQAQVMQAFGGAVRKVADHYREEGRREEAEKIAERQRIDLLRTMAYRVAEKVGKITDAAGLAIGMNGEINGYVEGDKGGATINTILAGGWNIQCLHFRVLVK